MSMHRFFAPGIKPAPGKKIVLPEKARHHAGRVLRICAGERLVLFDGRGTAAVGSISFSGRDAFVEVDSILTETSESPVRITLVQALVSPEKMDWIIEKAVETGVSMVIAVPAARSVVKLSGERLEKRLVHWRDTAISACEQCGRNWLPEISFLASFQKATEAVSADARYILAPAGGSTPKLTGLKSVAFAVGPEGGFSPEEVGMALSAGWHDAQIGPRVLRTETAGIVAATLANAASGDFHFR